MANLSTSESGLHSIVYWVVLLVLGCFVTFFLNSMVELANAEEHQYSVSSQVDSVKMQNQLIDRRSNSASTDEENF